MILDGLPGCPYRMLSYREEDVAEVDPRFGVQLHHPVYQGACVSSVIGSFPGPGRMGPDDG